jgi:Big-like domain-containing protein
MHPSRFCWYVFALVILLAPQDRGEAAFASAPELAWAAKSDLSPSPLPPSVGLNKFDLFRQYLGKSGDAKQDASYQKVSQALARKAMLDARNIGVTYFRVGITGIAPQSFDSPGELDFWKQDSQQYWALFDQMMTDLQSNGLHLIPVFVWNWAQFAAMTGEKSSQMVTDPNSQSYKLLERYVTEFVERYRGHPALYFYELTNELNLAADLDEEARCRNARSHPEFCAVVGNISTSQMIGFTKRLAACIRKLDRSHLISSGFALPRGNAEHLRATPEFVNWSAIRPADSATEFRKNLKDIHEGLDIVSIHFYNNDNERLGIKGHYNADLLDIVKQATDEMGKLLFVGEFADKKPTVSEDQNAFFTQNVLKKIVGLKIPFSAPWCWEFYHRLPKPNDMGRENTSLEPGLTDLIISKVVESNKALGNPGLAPTEQTRPNVIVTYPLDGATLALPEQAVHIVASSGVGISKVVLLLDEKVVKTLSQPPYQFVLPTAAMERGPHQIMAKAYARSDDVAEFHVRVVQGAGVPRPAAGGTPK